MAAEHRGKITAWKDDKGYGFITPDAGGPDVFVHVSSFPDGLKRPPLNAPLTYVLGYDSQQRLRAARVHFDRDPVKMPLLPAIVVGLFFVGLAGIILATHASLLLFVAYVALSSVTFYVYGADKAIAVRNEGLAPTARRERRMPEKWLHTLELLCGWPGALIAQWYYRHKNRKAAYQLIFWLVVAMNLALLGAYVIFNLLAGEIAGRLP